MTAVGRDGLGGRHRVDRLVRLYRLFQGRYRTSGVRVLDVAGSRERGAPGSVDRVELCLVAVFRQAAGR